MFANPLNQTVGTFLVAITLAGTGIGLGSHSIGALLEAAPETIPGSIAIYGALGSILFKELLYQVHIFIFIFSNETSLINVL
jgi:divalent metal cation (Fe/Co/Zn/Cd) transporter